MRIHSDLGFIFVAALWAAAAMAGDPGAGEATKLLRAQGLVPVARAPGGEQCWSLDVNGVTQKPVQRKAPCFPWGGGRTELKGKLFSYVADNRGEWGGKLLVREGQGKPRVLVRENVVDLVPYADDLYVFAGLDHLGADHGAVFVIENYDTKPRVRFSSGLPGTPLVVKLDERNWRGFIVATRLSLSVVYISVDGVEVLMARHAPLTMASSILPVGDADLLVGIRGGIAQVHFPWRMKYPPDPLSYDQIPIVTYWAGK